MHFFLRKKSLKMKKIPYLSYQVWFPQKNGSQLNEARTPEITQDHQGTGDFHAIQLQGPKQSLLFWRSCSIPNKGQPLPPSGWLGAWVFWGTKATEIDISYWKMYPIPTCDPGILPYLGILSPDLLPKSSKIWIQSVWPGKGFEECKIDTRWTRCQQMDATGWQKKHTLSCFFNETTKIP